jgi:hypothetical protein
MRLQRLTGVAVAHLRHALACPSTLAGYQHEAFFAVNACLLAFFRNTALQKMTVAAAKYDKNHPGTVSLKVHLLYTLKGLLIVHTNVHGRGSKARA